MRRYICIVLFVGLFTLTGCSRNQPLGGTVTFSDDGTPAPRGVVVFSTPIFVAQGSIKPDGTYQIGSEDIEDGIPHGTYNVAVMGVDKVTSVAGADGRASEQHTPLIDPKYTRAETSGLTFTVDGKTNTFDIKVDRAK